MVTGNTFYVCTTFIYMKQFCAPGYICLAIVFGCWLMVINSGCANIIPPAGGPRDSLPPILIGANPPDSTTGYKGNRITLYFNEFVEVQNAYENVIVSPTPANIPAIDYKLRTVSIRLRDTLESNTTYSINFGNSIRDVNEGNVYSNFTYVFSTGNTIDEHTLSGKVMLAENGSVDTTLLVVLHRNLADSAVAKERPRYITRLDGQGNFRFTNLPAGTFAIYAIPNDFSKHYDDSTKLFAFADTPVSIGVEAAPVLLNAYSSPKVAAGSTPSQQQSRSAGPRSPQDKNLCYSTNLQSGKLGLFDSLVITFNKPIFNFDSTDVLFTNKDFNVVAGSSIIVDSSRLKFTVSYPWAGNMVYNFLMKKEAFEDSAGLQLVANDTIQINTRTEQEYGSVKVRFTNLDLSKNPVLQLVQSDQIFLSVPLTTREWYRRLFFPGDYQLRILYDDNKNGRWDAGNFFGKKRQPELVKDLKVKLSVRPNWDNEQEIRL